MARRRGPPLHPQTQTHTSEDGAGLARRRRCSPRIRPQIHVSEEGAGMTCRRSPRLHSQTPTSEDGAGMACRRSPRHHRRITRRRRRGTSPATPASLQDNEDMLWEILLRLPPQPSSLPRASAVCRRWRGILTDARFHRQFYAHHRNPPLLGSFVPNSMTTPIRRRGIIMFAPIPDDPPNRIPPPRFDLGRCSDYEVLGCRHGRVLVKHRVRNEEVVVCDPITGEQRRLAFPPDLKGFYVNGAVLCAAADHGHVHGGCHSSPFKVVMVSMYRNINNRLFACVYSSETGIWGDLIATEAPCRGISGKPAVLVGNCLYWLSCINDGMLEFDLDENSLTMTRGPPVTTNVSYGSLNRQIVQAEDGAVGYAVLSYPCFHMWRRNVDGHGVATWLLWKTIQMDSIPGLPPPMEGRTDYLELIHGYDEDTDVIFLHVEGSVHMVTLKTMQSRVLYETRNHIGRCHPFRSFFVPAIRESDEADTIG